MQITQIVRDNYNSRKISAQKQPNFTSKNEVIRKLSDISMRTRREFPLFSNTMIENYHTYQNPAMWKVYRYTEGLVGEIRGYSSMGTTKGQRVLRTLDATKELRVGNCGEYAQATYVACKLNGFDDAKVLSLCAYNPIRNQVRLLDHAVVGIHFNQPFDAKANITKPIYISNNDAIIVDTWAGMTDYERNMTTKYMNDKFTGHTMCPDEIMCYVETGDTSHLTRDEFLFLKHRYPNLSSKKSSLKDKLRWWVLDKEAFEFAPIGTLIKEAYRTNIGMKRAKTSAELTELYTKEAQKNAEMDRIKKSKRQKDKHDPILQIRNKMRSIGQKIFK